MDRDLQEEADGSPFPNPTALSQMPSAAGCGSSLTELVRGETTDPRGGNIPVGETSPWPWSREMCPAPRPQPWHPCPDPDNAQEFPCSVRGLGPSQWPPQPCPRVPRPGVWVCGGCVPRRTLGQQDKRYFLSPSLSFPCQAPPGASGAEARPPSDSISYPVNPCRAGLEGQENRDMPAGKVTRCDPLLWWLHQCRDWLTCF